MGAEGACRGASTVDYLQEPVVEEVGRQGAGASLLELEVMEVGCCLKAGEEARRSSTEAQRSPLVGEERLRVSLEVRWVAMVRCHDQALVLQVEMVEGGPHETSGSGVVWVCWVPEEGVHLECLVWMRNLDGL